MEASTQRTAPEHVLTDPDPQPVVTIHRPSSGGVVITIEHPAGDVSRVVTHSMNSQIAQTILAVSYGISDVE